MAILLFLCVISATTHLCESRSSHCSAGIFTAGKDAFVDCDFNADVSISNHHIYVTWSPSNINNKEKDVLTCWTHHNNESSCTLAEGYYYEGGISDHLKLLIPDVTPRFSGVYSCKLSMNNYSLSDFAACNLTVKEPEDTKPCSDFSSYTISMTYQSILLTFTCILVISLAVKTFCICPDQCYKCLAGGSHHKGSRANDPVWYMPAPQNVTQLDSRRTSGVLAVPLTWGSQEEDEAERDLVRYMPAPQNVGSEPERDLVRYMPAPQNVGSETERDLIQLGSRRTSEVVEEGKR